MTARDNRIALSSDRNNLNGRHRRVEDKVSEYGHLEVSLNLDEDAKTSPRSTCGKQSSTGAYNRTIIGRESQLVDSHGGASWGVEMSR